MNSKGQLLTYEIILTVIIIIITLILVTTIEKENNTPANIEEYQSPSYMLNILEDKKLLTKLSKQEEANSINKIDAIISAHNTYYQLNDLSYNRTIINRKKESENAYASIKTVNKHTYQLIYYK